MQQFYFVTSQMLFNQIHNGFNNIFKKGQP